MKKEILNKEFGLVTGDKIVIKVGSNVLAGKNNGVNLNNIKNIVKGIDYLMTLGLNIFLVSSGAVAIGKAIMEKDGKTFYKNLNDDKKAFLAQIGQIRLTAIYENLFSKRNIIIGQNLLTHKNFKEKKILDNLKNVWELNIQKKVLAIINENDVISREELKFSDNDELAGLVTLATQAKVLVLLSNINGIYKNFGKNNEELIREVNDILEVRNYCEDIKSSSGTGGMKSKLNVMEKILENNRIGVIANGNKKGIIENIFGKEKNILEKILKRKELEKTIFRN